MDTKLKAKWVKALRSGKYAQSTDGGLFDGSGYCCLGVLRHVNDKSDLSSWRDIGGYLTDCHLRKFGLSDTEQMELASVNDCKVPFPVIAGFIQENL